MISLVGNGRKIRWSRARVYHHLKVNNRMNNETNRLNPQVNRMAKPLGYVVSILLPLLTSSIQAKDLEIGVSFSIPPYVIQQTNSGLELELRKSALAVKGHNINIQ